MNREYDYVIALGEKCFTAQAIYKMNLRKTSGPFDWLDCFSSGAGLKRRLEIILNHFDGFWDKNLLVPVWEGDVRNIRNIKTNILFRHEIATDESIDENFQKIAEKYARRIKRFFDILASGKRVLLVYAASLYENSDANDTLEKVKQIQQKFNNPNIDILVVDSNKELNKHNKIKIKQVHNNVLWVSGCDLYKPVSESTSEYYVGVMMNILKKVVKPYQPKLIVSLTSFPARINTVHQVIESLINQTKKADKIILWLAPEQFPNGEADLPKSLLRLKESGLTIDWYHDIRSYKKLIPTLRKYPNELIVTVDDDIIYKPTMLEKLYRTHIKHPKDVACHRATKFVYKRDKFKTIAGGKKHYRGAHFLNKLTGCGGVLYPPHCFYKDILNEDLIMKLAPTNDDQWFWLMAALNRVGVRVVKDKEIDLHYTEGSQEFALCLINDQGEKLFWKDFNRLIEHYPQLKKLLKKEGIKARWFYKERDGNRRRFYLFGKRILSYKKSKKKLADLNKKELTKLLWEQFYKKTGKKPTDELTTLAHKVIWASMFDVTELKVQCTDKIAVRDYVAETVGDKYLPELYAVYDNEKQFDLDLLPDKFLLTYNAGANSEHTMLVWDKSKLNQTDVQNTMKQWLKYSLAEIGYEMQYLPIKPRIMARELLDIRTDIEYKLWCFNGRVEFVYQNNYARGHDTIGFATYDKNWNKLDFWQKLDNSYQVQKKVQKPKFLNEMIEVAEKLAKPFNFVRVDFYETVDGKLMFGELTFSPSAGKLEFMPNNAEIQQKYGTLFKIPERDKNGFAVHIK